jgi:transmembrane sensor
MGDETRASTIDAQARAWIVRLDGGEVDAATQAAFHAWLDADPQHRHVFQARQRLWQGLAGSSALSAMLAMPAKPRSPRRVRRWIGRRPASMAVLAAAASVAAILATPELLLRARADHRAGDAVLEVPLPDGSVATLDAGAAIALDFGADRRSITLLAGNAFFSVRHGDARPFRVALPDGIAEDVGTRFELRRGAGGGSRLSVAEGAVRAIGNGGSKALLLHAGQAVTFGAQGPVRVTAPAEIAAWRTGDIVIERQPVAAAIREIARYRSGPTFDWSDAAPLTPISGAFRVDRADDALDAVARQAGLSVRYLPGGVAIVSGSGTR